MRTETLLRLWPLALVVTFGLVPAVQAASPAELLADCSAQAGSPASPDRGQKLFTTNFGKTLRLSCSSCHTADPARPGLDEITE